MKGARVGNSKFTLKLLAQCPALLAMGREPVLLVYDKSHPSSNPDLFLAMALYR